MQKRASSTPRDKSKKGEETNKGKAVSNTRRPTLPVKKATGIT